MSLTEINGLQVLFFVIVIFACIVVIGFIYTTYTQIQESESIKTMTCDELHSKIQKNDFQTDYNLQQATSLYTVNCVATKP